MAYIGLYGVYYSICAFNSSGAWTGAYVEECRKMGKAISASFTPATGGENNLYADNAIAETASIAAAGGTLTLTLDRLDSTAIQKLFGLTKTTETVQVGTTNVNGTGFNFNGSEAPPKVGVGFIRQKQEDNNRNHYEAIIFGCVTFQFPADDAQTLGDTVEWQTPTITGTVTTGEPGTAWMKRFEFPTEAAAIKWLETTLAD